VPSDVTPAQAVECLTQLVAFVKSLPEAPRRVIQIAAGPTGSEPATGTDTAASSVQVEKSVGGIEGLLGELQKIAFSNKLVALNAKIEAVHEQTWTKDTFNVELTRALTAIENARMEWNGARLKFPVLSGQIKETAAAPDAILPASSPFTGNTFGELCRLGLALTWPLATVALLALGVLVALLFRR
jgi:hypothetical protein